MKTYAKYIYSFIDTRVLMKAGNFINVTGLPEMIQIWVISSWNINIVCPFDQLMYVSLHLLNWFLCLLSSCSIGTTLLQSICLLCLKF